VEWCGVWTLAVALGEGLGYVSIVCKAQRATQASLRDWFAFNTDLVVKVDQGQFYASKV